MDQTTYSDEKFPLEADHTSDQVSADESAATDIATGAATDIARETSSSSSSNHLKMEDSDAIAQAVESEYETVEAFSGETSFEGDPENDVASSHEHVYHERHMGDGHTHTPYVRERRVHKTVAPINDFARDEEDEAAVSHDSEFTLSRTHHGHGSRSWRRSKAEIAQLKKDLHYGQYLQVPKGQRDIFVKKERRMHAGSLIAAVVVLAIIAVVAYFLWTWMSATWGSAVR